MFEFVELLLITVWALLSWAALRWLGVKEAEYDKQRKLEWARRLWRESRNASFIGAATEEELARAKELLEQDE